MNWCAQTRAGSVRPKGMILIASKQHSGVLVRSFERYDKGVS